jgi:hypothetical protein
MNELSASSTHIAANDKLICDLWYWTSLNMYQAIFKNICDISERTFSVRLKKWWQSDAT